MLLVRFFLVVFFVVAQNSKAIQAPKLLPRIGSAYPQIFRKESSHPKPPSTSPITPLENASVKQNFPMLFPVPKGDDGLFLRYMPRSAYSPLSENPITSKSSNLQPVTPVHGQEPQGDDEFFHHRLTTNSNPMKHIYDKYRLRYYPGQDALEKYFDKLKTGIRENPYTCSIYGGVGAGFGASSGLFWNYLYRKGAELGERTPGMKESWPRVFAALKKGTNSPTFRRTLITKASGKFCLVGVGLAVASGLTDHADFSSTLKPTLTHIGNELRTALSHAKDNLANTVLSVGDYLDYSPDSSTVQRE